MPFLNSIIAGGGTLVRDQIKSPNYVPSTTGWMIGRDGSAEFNDVSIRGALNVTGTDGSIVSVYTIGGQATIDLTPGTVAGQPWTPGDLLADHFNDGSEEAPIVVIESPYQTGVANVHQSFVALYGGHNSYPNSFMQLSADTIDVITDTCTVMGQIKFGTSTSQSFATRLLGFATASANVSGIVGVATVTDSVTVNVIAGRIYRIAYTGRVQSTAVPTTVQNQMKLSTGTVLVTNRYIINDSPWPVDMTNEYWTAPTTGSVTFQISMVRAVGAGTVTRLGTGDLVPYFSVEEVG